MSEAKKAKVAAVLERGIGPQVPGGRYRCGYWQQEYTVLAIGRSIEWVNGQAQPGIFWIAVLWADGSRTTHRTAWGPRDSVVAVG